MKLQQNKFKSSQTALLSTTWTRSNFEPETADEICLCFNINEIVSS